MYLKCAHDTFCKKELEKHDLYLYIIPVFFFRNLSVFMNYHKTHAMSMSAFQVLIAEIRKHETELSDIERSLQGTPQIPFKDHTKGMPTWVCTNQCVHKCIYIIYIYIYI